MKILKKINKGLILTIIVLLVLTIYLVNIEKQREADKKEIQQTCEEFIDFTDKYAVLPKEMQKLGETISKSKIEEYKKEMKEELEKLMISNEEAVKLQYQNLETYLDEGYSNPRQINSKVERKITEILKYEFEEDQVRVIFDSNIKTNIKCLNEKQQVQEKQQSLDANGEEILLQKIEGKWKIVYSNLTFSEYYKETIKIF